MGSIVVYHFEMSSKAQQQSVSKRPATREAIEALGFKPLMETAQVVDTSQLDGLGFVRGEMRGE